MKSKILTSFILSISLLIFLMSFTTATLTLSEVSGVVPTNADPNSEITATFELTATENYTSLEWAGTATNAIFTELPTITSINSGETQTLTAVLTIDSYASGIIDDAEIIVTDDNTTNTDSFTLSDITINDVSSLSVSDSTISKTTNSTTIIITNTGNTDLTNIQLTYSGDFDVSFSPGTFDLTAGNSQSVLVTATSDLDDLDLGTNHITVTATSGTTTDSGRISAEGEYCNYDNLGNNLEITIKDIDVTGESFGDGEEWYAFDEIEVEVKVENNGDDDIKDITIEWGVFDRSTGKFLIDDEESDFNLKDDDSETLTITFKLDEDIEDLQDGDFIFIAKATGEDDDFDGDKTCTSDYQDIEIITPNDFVVLDDIDFQETVSCGSTLQITADVWNIGEDDQDDVEIRIYSTDLGIDERRQVGDVDAFEDESFTADIKIPSDVSEGVYQIEFWVYDEDGDEYESEDDDKSVFYKSITVTGDCEISGDSGALITAGLESDAIAGEELLIRAIITNTKSSTQTYAIELSGYSEWAELVSLNPELIVLNSGDSEEILITLKADNDASGEHNFNIEAVADGKAISQPVSVFIESKGGFPITGGIIGTGNAYLWGIGILNIILVVIIIIVAMRVIKRK